MEPPTRTQPAEIPEALLIRLQKGESEAYEEFVSAYGPRLLQFGRRMCRDAEDAREVFQDTLLKTFESVGTLRHPGAFRTWLYRIAANACWMRRRKSQFLKEEIPLDEALPGRSSLQESTSMKRLPDLALMDGELRSSLEEAIRSLPPASRMVLLLRDVEGLTTEEAAGALGIGADAVKMRLHRARAKVRALLQSKLHPPPKGQKGAPHRG